MKRLFYLFTCFVFAGTFASCVSFDEKPSNKESQEIKTIVELPDSVKKQILAQDSVMNELLCKIDTLTKELNSSKGDLAKLQQSVEGMESPRSMWNYMTLGALALSIITLVVSFIKTRGVTKEQVGEQIKQSLDESRRINELQENVRILLQRNRNTSPQSNCVPQNIENRLRQLEKTTNQVSQYINSFTQQRVSQSNNAKPSSSSEPDYQRAGYANINSGSIFTKILDSAQEGCVFSIKFKNANEGEFSIISIDKIKSRNGWQEIVEYTGSIEDATSFKVEEYGVCIKYDDVTWQVTKKLKIKLLK